MKNLFGIENQAIMKNFFAMEAEPINWTEKIKEWVADTPDRYPKRWP